MLDANLYSPKADVLDTSVYIPAARPHTSLAWAVWLECCESKKSTMLDATFHKLMLDAGVRTIKVQSNPAWMQGARVSQRVLLQLASQGLHGNATLPKVANASERMVASLDCKCSYFQLS